VTITALYDLINLKNRNKVNFCPDTGIFNKKKERKKTRKKSRQKERNNREPNWLTNKLNFMFY
jgi:hypothetical protein